MNATLAKNIAEIQLAKQRRDLYPTRPFTKKDKAAISGLARRIGGFSLNPNGERWFNSTDNIALQTELGFTEDQCADFAGRKLRLNVTGVGKYGKAARSADLVLEANPADLASCRTHLLGYLVVGEAANQAADISLSENPWSHLSVGPSDPEFHDLTVIVNHFLPAEA